MPKAPAPKTASAFVAERLREIRERRHLNQQQLAERLKRLGWSLDRTIIAKIENGTRNVSIDDVIALAAALNVSPIMLISPRGTTPAIAVGAKNMPPDIFRRWSSGAVHTVLFDAKGQTHESDSREYREEMSDHDWRASERLPSLGNLKRLVGVLEDFAAGSPTKARLTKSLDDIDVCISHLRDEVKIGDSRGTH